MSSNIVSHFPEWRSSTRNVCSAIKMLCPLGKMRAQWNCTTWPSPSHVAACDVDVKLSRSPGAPRTPFATPLQSAYQRNGNCISVRSVNTPLAPLSAHNPTLYWLATQKYIRNPSTLFEWQTRLNCSNVGLKILFSKLNGRSSIRPTFDHYSNQWHIDREIITTALCVEGFSSDSVSQFLIIFRSLVSHARAFSLNLVIVSIWS